MTCLRKKKLLVAEDDASMRRFLEVLLQQAGFDVISAEDGLAALQLAAGGGIDAVIADAVMPNMSGYDLCRILKADANFSNTSFIILSGLPNGHNENIADLYLLKEENLKEKLLAELARLFAVQPTAVEEI